MKKFKVDTFYVVCDVIISELGQRFGDSDGLLKDVSLLSTKRMKEVRKNLKLILTDTFTDIYSVYKKYFDHTMLIEEYKQFIQNLEEIERARQLPKILHSVDVHSEDVEDSDQFSFIDLILEDDNENIDMNNSQDELSKHQPISNLSIVELFQIFCSAKLNVVFPMLYVLLKICVTLPVSSCSVERSFSKLKLLKTKLRSTMLEARLGHLMKICCEEDISVDKN